MIRVVDHDPGRTAMFEAEAGRILRAAGSAIVRMHHVGSTVIPATRAKPGIDMPDAASLTRTWTARTHS